MVDFHGWQLPLHYGSQLAEHHCVRQSAGMFDVSHMTVIDISAAGAKGFLRWLLPGDVHRLQVPGQALYSALLNDQGGIIDDLILYLLPDAGYRLVINCATKHSVLGWLDHCRKIWCERNNQPLTIDVRPELAIVAVQGPEALVKYQACLPKQADVIESLTPFSGVFINESWVARTGYTGESGLEIILPEAAAKMLWNDLLAQGVQPAGLGARDTLRLEAGLNLYGQDMDETLTPLESNMAKIIHWQPKDRDFIGRDALKKQKQSGVQKQLRGLILQTPGVPRSGYLIHADSQVCGKITSGLMSPTLKCGIALARVGVQTPEQVTVEIRNTKKAALLKPLPFYRKPKDSQKLVSKEKTGGF